ncbi:hypothetical protein [Variovorax sp. HW608]|uniref:hypothetical protein n=1 Tax=Variovorax sp. HW608 TaxID=1034889 RepID=UPI0012FE2C09|nr:hypothetical protein [Variovorax sp. HW608]
MDTYWCAISSGHMLSGLAKLNKNGLRRTITLIREGVTMGVIIGLIEGAPAGSPLEQLKPQVKNLRSFNEFASLFHHDTQGKIPRSSVTDGELHPFAKQAMAFVHLGSMN